MMKALWKSNLKTNFNRKGCFGFFLQGFHQLQQARSKHKVIPARWQVTNFNEVPLKIEMMKTAEENSENVCFCNKVWWKLNCCKQN